MFSYIMDGAVGFAYDWFASGFDADGPVVVVQECVMVPAEQRAVVDVGRPAVFPVLAVVHITPTWWPATTREHATAVS